MKKITALLLACLLITGLWPAGTAFGAGGAYKQAPVSDVQMYSNDAGGATGDNYKYSVSWARPLLYNEDTNAVSPVTPYASRYEVYYRNATPGKLHSQSAFTTTYMDAVNDITQADTRVTRSFTKAFASGSLYEFRIVPYHQNNYAATDSTGQPTTTQGDAPVDSGGSVPAEMRAIFLTDIKVTASGEGNTLTVTWDNPTWGNARLFDAYRLSYQVNDGTGQAVGPLYDRDVSMNDVTVNADGTLSYTITDNTLQTGYAYDVKVEPMRGGKRVRLEAGASAADLQAVNIINLANINYYLTYRNPSSYEYKTSTPALIVPSLRANQEGDDYIRFDWNSLAGMPNANLIERVEIVELNPNTGEVIPPAIAILSGSSAQNINFWRSPKPAGRHAYRLDIYLTGNTTPQSTKVVYFDEGDFAFTPYKPDVLQFAPDAGVLGLNLTWLAFAREPYNDAESASRDANYPGSPYIDIDISYDIYVTDNWQIIDNVLPIMPSVPARTLKLNPFYPDPNDPQVVLPSYSSASLVTQYCAENTVTGLFEMLPITDNKVYYVKIVAKRISSGQTSQPAYGSVFMPAGVINLNPNIIDAPPLRVKSMSDTDITVTWDTRYLEIYRPDPTNPTTGTWNAVVGITKNGDIIYGKSAMDIQDGASALILNDIISDGTRSDLYALGMDETAKINTVLSVAKTEIKSALAGSTPSASLADPVTLRIIDLTNASYELHTVEYLFMLQQGSNAYEAYYSANLTGADNPAWKPAPNVVPGVKTGMLECTITSSDAPTPGAVTSNTAYVIYMRPFMMGSDNVKRVAYYPNYVTVTTQAPEGTLDIEPVTPTLKPEPDKTTDMTLSVYWNWVNLEYDLAYSENLSDYPGKGTTIAWSIISPTATIVTDGNGNATMHFTIPDMFPDTAYYIWIRSRAINSTGPVNSDWSNPINMKTLDIQAPVSPQGLGPAGQEHVNAYNKQNTTKYAAEDVDALIIEWMRNGDDTAVPAAGGTVTGGSATNLTLAELTSMYMVRFDTLIANRSYYVRAKTVLTVSRSGSAGTNEKIYNYVVQMALTSDFKDCIEFTIPALAAASTLDPVYAKRKESGWCTTVRLYTTRTTGEYDGDVDPEQYPLPAQDWEITFDPYTGTLTQRFRSSQSDTSGAKDQQADQRFISRLVADKTYVYAIDLTSYGTRRVYTRVVTFPYSIMKAFDERKITLEVTADNMTLSVAPGTFDTAAVRALPDMGAGAQLSLTLSAQNTGFPALSAGESYASQPQKLSAQITTPSRSLTIENFAKPVSVKMALNSRVTPMEQQVGLYYSNSNTGGWSSINSNYAPATVSLNAGTYKPGTFAGIAKATPATSALDTSRDAMHRVTAKLNITDMKNYNASDLLSPNRFNNLMAAVANNQSQVAMNAPLSSADSQALSRAKLLVADTVTREAAASAMVTLYELKTKQIIQPSATAETTPYADIAAAPEAYRKNLLKAVEVGILTTPLQLGKTMTMGEMMQMLDIVMQDAGM